MTQDTPRFTPDNPAADQQPAVPDGVTWWALVGLYDPPLALGRTPADAEERLHAQLLQFHREEADPLPADPDALAARDLDRWKKGALLTGFAREELAAFLAWRLTSSLSMEEALLRWREVFPAPEGPDPLGGLIGGDESASPPARGGGRRTRPGKARPPRSGA